MSVITGRCLIGQTLVPSELYIKDGLISEVVTIDTNEDLAIIAPGFIDIQVNGAADELINDKPDETTLAHIGRALRQLGTTAWLATLVTDEFSKMQSLADAVAGDIGGISGVLGIHYEGPHINPAKKGVHSETHIRVPSGREWSLYNRQDIGCRLLTIAPETLDTETLLALKNFGCTLSVGHSAADYEIAQAAIESGIDCATHLYNAMTGATSRCPGVVGAVLDSEIPYGIILDGEHVHPAMARLAYRVNSKMILVTDAMPLLGSKHRHFDWFGERITKEGHRLTDENGRLAGACISQLEALQNAQTMLNIDLIEALHMVTRNPAQLLGVFPHYGAITVGSRADLVALNEHTQLLDVWYGGERQAS